MRSPRSLVLLSLILACNDPVEGPGPPSAPSSNGASATAARRYVQASSLNLRAGPDPSSPVTAKLEINAPLQVMLRQGEFEQVKTDTDLQGWVVSAYLADTPLAAEQAARQARAANDPLEALSWWQRATAIAPTRTHLQALAASYRRLDQPGVAVEVEKRLAWPTSVHPALPMADGGARVEWRVLPTALEGEPMSLSAADAAVYGLHDGARWWVLPDQGPAVEADAARFMHLRHNECAASSTIDVELVVSLPPERVAVAVALGDPPAHWLEPAPEPLISRQTALALVQAEVAANDGAVSATIGLAPDGVGWRARAAWPVDCGNPTPETTAACAVPAAPDPPHHVLDLRVTADGTLGFDDMAVEPLTHVDLPLSRRDVDGDGEPETLWHDGCRSAVVAVDGAVRVATTSRCCGC